MIERFADGIIPDADEPALAALEEQIANVARTLPHRIEEGFDSTGLPRQPAT